jgi:TRAP-type C4-dicarboxylate transport system permease small subunit
MVVVVFFTVPYVTASNGHINVDIIRYPKRVSHFLEIIHYLLGFLLAGFFTWRTFAFVIDSIQSHRIMLGTEGGITIPVWPLALVIVFGFAVMAFSYVVHFLNALGIFGKKDIAHTSQEA